MSEEMKISKKRMKHVFNEMVVKAGKDVDTAEVHFIGGGVSAVFYCAQQAHHATHAINVHDQNQETITKQAQRIEELEGLVRLFKSTSDDITQYKHMLSYNESYVGEPKGVLKNSIGDLDMVSCKAIRLLQKDGE